MMSKGGIMRAYRIHEWQSEPKIEDVNVPEPGSGEVLIKIAGVED
jgi:propanol-preferring alcohol dehydrogenase